MHADPELEADVFEELDEDLATRLLGARTDAEIAAVLARMRADDAADAIAELPQQRRQPVLDLLPPGPRKKVLTLMGFPSGSAGGLMGMDFIALPGLTRVGDALARVRESPLLQPEALTSVHAVDADGGLQGVARLVTLVQSDPDAALIDVSDTDPVRVGADADITDVAVLMTDYNLITIPVVDDAGRLLGVITVDDVLEIALPPDWRRREAAQPPDTRPLLVWRLVQTGGMTEASPRFRSVLDSCPVYKPGRIPVSSSGKTHKLSSNETPFAPLPSVVDAIAEAARSVHRYPDNGAQALIRAIADKFGVPPEHVAVGCGSVGVAQQLLEAVGEPGAEVMYAWRSFEAYPILSDLAGADSVRVPLRGQAHDLAAMAAAITPRTRLIFVCNPNNPTGTVVHTAELEAFLDQVPADCLVVLDEAYREYIRDEAVPDGLDLYRDRPNVAVLRTFSKAYGLAGLRTGFMIAHEPVAAAARTTMLPFSVNSIAQAAAVASLAAEDELFERVEHTVKERTRVREALVADGWAVPPTEANFVWLSLGEHTLDFAAACFDEGIAIRPFAGDGARVSIGDAEANDAFLAVARAYPHRNASLCSATRHGPECGS